jgi:hypothetical protein
MSVLHNQQVILSLDEQEAQAATLGAAAEQYIISLR